jgi:DNA-binding XRE family transcriptional regulator
MGYTVFFQKKLSNLLLKEPGRLDCGCTENYTWIMEHLPHFAARLRQLRAAAKMTQHELAERSGIHRQTIARIELGDHQPSWQTALALARALGVNCLAFQEDAGQAEAPPAKKGRKR